MNQTLRTVNSILKPIERITTSFISDPMTAEDISFIEANRTILETRMEKIVQTQKTIYYYLTVNWLLKN